ncbi:hypothetical protein D3C87_1676150 [compost metagenome]
MRNRFYGTFFFIGSRRINRQFINTNYSLNKRLIDVYLLDFIELNRRFGLIENPFRYDKLLVFRIKKERKVQIFQIGNDSNQ